MLEFTYVHCQSPQWHIYVDRYYRGRINRVGDGFGVFLDGETLRECETFEEAQGMVCALLGEAGDPRP